jgi:hypothetical protein
MRQNLVAGIEALHGHDVQGEFLGALRAAGERFLAKRELAPVV